MGVTDNWQECCMHVSAIHFKDWKRTLGLEFVKDIIDEWDSWIDSSYLTLTRHQFPGKAPRSILGKGRLCHLISVHTSLMFDYQESIILSVRDGENKHLVIFLFFWGRGAIVILSTVRFFGSLELFFSVYPKILCSLTQPNTELSWPELQKSIILIINTYQYKSQMLRIRKHTFMIHRYILNDK